MLARSPDRWLVVVTDRDETDLGPGVLTHLLWHRLRTPDPWDAVRHRFAAVGIDPGLLLGEQHRELAVGLLAATPSGGWPPAPGGVLTRGHALAAVAARPPHARRHRDRRRRPDIARLDSGSFRGHRGRR